MKQMGKKKYIKHSHPSTARSVDGIINKNDDGYSVHTTL